MNIKYCPHCNQSMVLIDQYNLVNDQPNLYPSYDVFLYSWSCETCNIDITNIVTQLTL